MEINQIIDILIDLSKKKEEYLKKLLTLTKKQEGFIRNGDLENLAVSIKQKEEIIKAIDQIDIKFLTNYNGLKNTLGVNAIEEIDTGKYYSLKELKLYISNIMMLLKQMKKVDQTNTEQLKVDFNKVKQDMKKLKEKKQKEKMASNYVKKYIGAQGVFIDHK
ncbi:MAG: flagellar export chaperone FlgN [Marinisporobacter sp.]|jgi:hypothetical protein|nr:flagellar export chaperone FlgN [Marinisporobacter sp.]